MLRPRLGHRVQLLLSGGGWQGTRCPGREAGSKKCETAYELRLQTSLSHLTDSKIKLLSALGQQQSIKPGPLLTSEGSSHMPMRPALMINE